MHVHLLPTPLGFGLPPILGQPRECFSILPVLYYSPQPWALQTQQSESPGCGLWPSLGCGHTHQVQSPASMESYFPATLRPTPGLCSLLTCFIFFFFKRKVFSSHAGKSNYAVTAVGWLGHNTTCQFSVAYTGAQKLLGIVLKSGIHFSHVNSYNRAKLDEIWLLHTLGKVGHWERQAFFFPLAVTSSLPLPRDEECPQISQEHNFVFTRL